MAGGRKPSVVCTLCGGKIEGFRVYMNMPTHPPLIETTCKSVGAELDAKAKPGHTSTHEHDMGAQCQRRRHSARDALFQPLKTYGQH
jgi:hypothetical protein